MTTYLLEAALLPTGVENDVLVRETGGRITEVSAHRGAAEGSVVRLPGLTIPGLANCHSHAFHRALRGRTQRDRGSFWTWRDQMYAVSARLDPDSYLELATATFREMAAAGITSVGEFHYLHHQPGGRPYDDPNAMGRALIEAARVAGIRITLLDTCYLSAGFGRAPTEDQRRFSDGSADAWADRVDALTATDHALPAAAIHSVRAVPREELPTVARWARERGAPLHVHLSEQRRENEECEAAYGLTPTGVLAKADALGPGTTVVHATHLGDDDIAALGDARAFFDLCPTTERDLGDGIGPGRRLHEAGARLTLGSDSHAVIDLFEEMRAVELHERLATETRGHWSAAELLTAATASGHQSLGWTDAGAIDVGMRADMVTLDTRSPRTAATGGAEPTVVFAATAADVVQVIADGRVIFRAEDREAVGRELERAVGRIWA